MDGPLLGKIKKFPLPAALGAAVVMAVHFAPAALGLRRVPDDLRIGTDEKIISPALELSPFEQSMTS